MNIQKTKYKIRNKYPDIWEQVKRVQWYFKLNVPRFYPQILKDLPHIRNNENEKKGTGQKILFFAVRQDYLHIAWELLLAKALKLRDVSVDYIACDGFIRNCCNERWYPELKEYVCKRCHVFSKKFYEFAKFDVNWLSSFSTPDEITNANRILDKLDFSDYRLFSYDGLPLGELVRPSVCHFCRIEEDIELFGNNDPVVRRIYRDFLHGAIMMTHICKRILSKHAPDVIVMINGIFMSERIMFETAKREGKRTVIIESGLLPDTMIFLHDNYIDYRMVEGWEKFKSQTLTMQEEKKLDDYIFLRKSGGGHTGNYWNNLKADKEKILEELSLKGYKKIVVLFPNVTWDSACYGLHIMFNSLKEWVLKTIEFFEKHPDHCLIIRSHPADMTWPQALRDSIYTWLKEIYKNGLPENVRLIPPDSSISSYTLMDMADFGLFYTSTTGLEMALGNKPVVVVAKVHYWNRGFTNDPVTIEEYFSIISKLLTCDNRRYPSFTNIAMARHYAYFIFFKASFYLKYIDSNGYRMTPEFRFSSYDELLPGNDPVLDMICNGIATGEPFYKN